MPDSRETFEHGDLSYIKTASRDREYTERQFKLTLLGGLYNKDAMVQPTTEETDRKSSAMAIRNRGGVKAQTLLFEERRLEVEFIGTHSISWRSETDSLLTFL